MKRKVAFLLSLLMLVMLLTPLKSSAGIDSGLEQAIKTSREMLDIPTSFTEFNYSVRSEGDKKIWNLMWNNKDGNGGNVNVTIDEKGIIRNYNYYIPYDYAKKTLPKISRQEAKLKAEAFINKVNPQLLPQIKLLDNNNYQNNDTHSFNYCRVENGLPFYNNPVRVEVGCATGEIQSYSYSWSDDMDFPAADKAISMELAKKAFTDKLGLKLVYNYTFTDDKLKIFPVYTLKYPNYYYIDALTGEKIRMEPGYYPLDGMGGMEKSALYSVADKADIVLTPDELQAVEKLSKVLNKDEVEKIARGVKVLELTDEFKLLTASLNRDWQLKDSLSWNLNFRKGVKSDGSDYKYVSVTMNAVSGEIKSFYLSSAYDRAAKAKYDEAASKKAVEAFLKDFNPEKFTQTEFDDGLNENVRILSGQEAPTQYSFSYVRKANGIQFPGNFIKVGYDAVNGKVMSFSMAWFDTAFPVLDKVLNLDNIYEKMFKDIGLELQYKTKNSAGAYGKIAPESSDAKPEVKIIYDLNRSKPVIFDAYTGIILNSKGEPYKEVKPAEYTDISGHYAEIQIMALAEYGISLEGTEFKPDEDIVQKDFFWLLSKIVTNYYGPAALSSDKDIDQLYSFLLREGIVKASEKEPDSLLTREDAVKFVIRALKYDKVADIKGIFRNDFNDADQISPDLVGYVTIAQGLKIIGGSDSCFNPKEKLSRAQTAIIIYNYLRQN